MVSYSPKTTRTQEAFELKKKYYLNGIRTTHWAQFPCKHGAKNNLKLMLNDTDNFLDLDPTLINDNIPEERLLLF
jgi:hypothetical protein